MGCAGVARRNPITPAVKEMIKEEVIREVRQPTCKTMANHHSLFPTMCVTVYIEVLFLIFFCVLASYTVDGWKWLREMTVRFHESG